MSFALVLVGILAGCTSERADASRSATVAVRSIVPVSARAVRRRSGSHPRAARGGARPVPGDARTSARPVRHCGAQARGGHARLRAGAGGERVSRWPFLVARGWRVGYRVLLALTSWCGTGSTTCCRARERRAGRPRAARSRHTAEHCPAGPVPGCEGVWVSPLADGWGRAGLPPRVEAPAPRSVPAGGAGRMGAAEMAQDSAERRVRVGGSAGGRWSCGCVFAAGQRPVSSCGFTGRRFRCC